MAYKELLKNIYLFKDFNHAELDPIQEICLTKTYNSGQAIFTQNDEAKNIFVIKYGSISISQRGRNGDTIAVSQLGTGSHFGEMPLLDGGKRSATATATEKAELIEIPYDALEKFLVQNTAVSSKFYKALAMFLCGRLRTTTTDLSFAREKNLTHF